MDITTERCVLAIFACMIAACSAEEQGLDPVAYEAGLVQWRIERLERLKGPDGYLNLVGLYWLGEGNSRLGSSADNDIVFPADAAPYIGELQKTEEGVVLITEPGVDIRYEDIPVRSILMSDDTTENPVTLTHARLRGL
jgi:uncharacterized protein (DUF1684 family)